MNKHQLIVISGGLVLLFSLFFFGRTKPGLHPGPVPAQPAVQSTSVSINDLLSQAKKALPPDQSLRVNQLEQSLIRGDLQSQKRQLYAELARFWKDSAHIFELYCYYTGEKAKLENSEKSLTFAANLFLQELRGVEEPGLRTWMAGEAKVLFEKALLINPANDSATVGLGSTYFFGAAGTTSPMEGILKIRQVLDKDSTNMYAQFMLAYGAVLSGQLDKAIERLNKVVLAEPRNAEAVFLLADAYEQKGDKANAVKWYEKGKGFVNRPELMEEIENRINTLKK